MVESEHIKDDNRYVYLRGMLQDVIHQHLNRMKMNHLIHTNGTLEENLIRTHQ